MISWYYSQTVTSESSVRQRKRRSGVLMNWDTAYSSRFQKKNRVDHFFGAAGFAPFASAGGAPLASAGAAAAPLPSAGGAPLPSAGGGAPLPSAGAAAPSAGGGGGGG